MDEQQGSGEDVNEAGEPGTLRKDVKNVPCPSLKQLPQQCLHLVAGRGFSDEARLLLAQGSRQPTSIFRAYLPGLAEHRTDA